MKKVSTFYKVGMILMTTVLFVLFLCMYSVAKNTGQSLDWRHYSLWSLSILMANGFILWNNHQNKKSYYKKNGYEFFCTKENGNDVYQKTLELKEGKRIFLAEFGKDGFCKKANHYDFDDVNLAMEAFKKQTSA